MREKHVFLDWDGVVNAHYYPVTRDPTGNRVHEARLTRHAIELPEPFLSPHEVFVDPDVVTRLNALSRQPGVSVFWLTATGFLTPEHYAPAIGLDVFPGVPGHPSTPGQYGAPQCGRASLSWWKTELVRAHLAASTADVLWVDDSISGDLRHHLRGMPGAQERLAWLVPPLRLGLSARNLDEIDRWAADEVPVRLGGRARRRQDPRLQRAGETAHGRRHAR